LSNPPVLAALLLAILAGGCSFEAGPPISAPEAFAMANAGRMTIIDIRTPKEWRRTGVSEGAVRIDMRQRGGAPAFVEKVTAQVDGKLDTPIALICRTGNRSNHMQGVLLDNGFTQVFNIREGMAGSGAGPGWIRRGLPVTPCPGC
jgi:rhodanese-related sulfurtransferase